MAISGWRTTAIPQHSRVVGGAHPFNLLNWSVVHNGEITSYGTNRRYIESYGYKCTMVYRTLKW